MIRSTNSPSLGFPAAAREPSAVRLPRLPQFGLLRLFIDAIEVGAKANSTAYLMAMGRDRPPIEVSQEKNDR